MRICLLGRLPDGASDEGMKNVARRYRDGLSTRHDVLMLDPRAADGPAFWTTLRGFHPDILHTIAGPTIANLALLRHLRSRTIARTIVSAIHPWFPAGTGRLIRFFCPDAAVVSSIRTRALFAGAGVRTEMLPYGVDTRRFTPASVREKADWRRALGLPADRYLLLHVGHVIRRRGLEVLADLQRGDQQVLVIGSENTPAESHVRRFLEHRGCLVWNRIQPTIERMYSACDCYMFPTRDPLGAIEMPLSVLEALAVNLPALAYPFGGLPDYLPGANGLVYEQDFSQWPDRLRDLRAVRDIRTRSAVLDLDWDRIIPRLEEIYRRVLAGEDTATA
jgi:glycosyltransferase involved in cell wall biosynthesis